MKYVDGIPMTHHRLYSILQGMKQRCYNQRNTNYNYYGGKGIRICDEWIGKSGFLNFYRWSISHGYEEGLTIDRVDSNEGYSPSNCIWVTPSRNGVHAPLWQQLLYVIHNVPTYECEYIDAQIKKIADSEIKETLIRFYQNDKKIHKTCSLP